MHITPFKRIDFASYCLATYHELSVHRIHDGEEARFFCDIERLTREKLVIEEREYTRTQGI